MAGSSSQKKRKAPPSGPDPSGNHRAKKSKGGSGNKWQTSHQLTKLDGLRSSGRMLEVGDAGFWVSCQRHKEGKTVDELAAICDEYGEKLYGLKAQSSLDPPEKQLEEEEEENEDIESSIKKELAAAVEQKSIKRDHQELYFDTIRVNVDCLIFVRTRDPVEPRSFVRRVCEDARQCARREDRKTRFINRLTPVQHTGKATENGVVEIARRVLRPVFELKGEEEREENGKGNGNGDEIVVEKQEEVEEQKVKEKQEGKMENKNSKKEEEKKGCSYAIRISVRAHNNLKRDDVIKQIAELIGPIHKVDLTNPDKVILVEIFQSFCGMSVVDGDWDAMKRYNMFELYAAATKAAEAKTETIASETS